MSKTKIMLFFEDNIDLKNKNPKRSRQDKNFVNLIKKQLTPDYEISNNYGKIGTTGFSGAPSLYFQKNNPLRGTKFRPDNELKNTNSRDMSAEIPGLETDVIPFFVIDTDGIEINNMCDKILRLEGGGIQTKQPTKWISGSGELLPTLLSSIIDGRILSKWGLILVNPNKEGSIYSSVKKNESDFDNILFGNAASNGQYKSSALGFCYFNKDGEQMRFIAADPMLIMWGGDKIRNQIGIELQIKIKEIWDNISEKNPDVLVDSISEDISEYYKLIVDTILDGNEASSKWKNEKLYKNAEDSVFSIYIKKRKETNPDYPGRLPKEILDERNISNFQIQFFDFSKLTIN
mgnify:FL=1